MTRTTLIPVTFAVGAALATAAAPIAAMATPLDPNDPGFTLLGALPAGSLTIDTGTAGDASSHPVLTYGSSSLQGDIVGQAGGPEIAVFTFAGGAVLGIGDSILVTGGSRPIALLFRGTATISGTIDVSGGNGFMGAASGVRGDGGFSVAGGNDGGAGGNKFSVPEAGFGPGGGAAGGASASNSGVGPGAGGGFGTDGGDNGAGVTQKAGGTAYGTPQLDPLLGGSGGGGGGGDPIFNTGAGGGGAGGGAIEIGALTELDILGASILANGGNGNTGNRDGGGGSGGGILLHAFDVTIDSASLLQANGGFSGIATNTGGCGGGGRIAALTNTDGSLTADGTIEAKAGGACIDSSAFLTAADATVGIPSVVASVAEPTALSLFGFGLVGLGATRRRRRG